MITNNPQHPEEITAEWLTHILKKAGILKKSSVNEIKKEIIGGGRGFLSSVLKVEITYDLPNTEAPESVVVKIDAVSILP